MQTTTIGQYVVTEYANYSNITRPAKKTDRGGLRSQDGKMILVDEVHGKNHYKRAVTKAKRLDAADNPTPEAKALDERLIELNAVAYGRRVHMPGFFLHLTIAQMKAEIARLEKIQANSKA